MSFKNLKIAINDQQPLKEVEVELHKKGWYKNFDSSKQAKVIIAVTDVHGKRRFTGYPESWINFDFGDEKVLTTLAELKEM